MSETSVPTMSDIHQAKLDMDDINTFVGSSADQFTDNGGKDRLTVTGITNQAFINAGYIDRGTFQTGATLTAANEILQYSGEYYRWSGAFDKIVAAGSTPSPVGVGGWIAVGDASVRAKLFQHENDAFAHPALAQFITEEADRAEMAAETAITNGKIYQNSSSGQADVNLITGAYFWVVSSSDDNILELWQKGASVATDTTKRSVSSEYVRKNGTEQLENSGLSFAVVGEDNSRTWLEADEEGKPTDYSISLIEEKLPVPVKLEDVPLPDANKQAFAIVGEDNSRTWLEVDEEGKPTDYSIESIKEKLPEAVALYDIPRPDLNTQGVAIVGEDDSRTWLEADEEGKPTDHAIKLISENLPFSEAGFYVDALGNNFKASSGPNIVAWGDSMTAGATGIPYTTYLQNMLAVDGKAVLVTNHGVGGESSITIAARAGGTPFTALVTGGVIPASGRVGIKLLPINGVRPEPLRQSGNYACTFAGAKGVFGKDFVDGVYNYWFERTVSGPVINTNRPETIYLDIAKNCDEDIAIIWVGQNTPAWVEGSDSNSRRNERAINDAKAIIRRLVTLDKRYLVITKPSGGAEMDAEDALWYNEFSDRFIPIRQYMVTPIYAEDGTTIVSCYGLQDAGFAATPADITDISQRRIPPSLRNDAVHWKAEGYEVLAKVIYKKLKELGWV